jgi:uncharacterized membrane protein
MNRITLSLTLFLTLILLVACGGNTPQTPLETEAPTETISQPTAIPADPATEAATESTENAASGNVSYTSQVAPIFEAKCIKCHGVESKKEGLDMLTYDNIMAGSRNGSVITPGNAADSLLVQLIVEGEMPNRGTKVTPEELQLIIDWVDQGALNN